MPVSNGGIPRPLNLWVVQSTSTVNPGIFTFDVTNFNDPFSSSFYAWKVEDIIAGRSATIRRVILSYRDLGVATITVLLSGTNDAQAVVTDSQEVMIGTVAASQVIVTQLVGITLTGSNLQLSISRAAGDGPVSITKARMEGTVETTVY